MSNLEPFNLRAVEPTAIRDHGYVTQAVWRFDNERGASVIRHGASYGVELAVLRFTGPGERDFTLDYSTPVTSDVIGYIQDANELLGYLDTIKALPPVSGELSATESALSVHVSDDDDDDDDVDPEWAPYASEEDAEDAFRYMLDECLEEVEIMGHSFLPSAVLKGTDPTAYREEFLNWHSPQWDEWNEQRNA